MKVTISLPDDVGDPDCPVRDILGRVGDKWTKLVIINLGNAGPLRFGELKRRIGGISQRMLTETVRGLERDGIVSRTVYPTIPPRVDYALTPMGDSILLPIQALIGWALEHRAEIKQARLTFDIHLDQEIQSAEPRA